MSCMVWTLAEQSPRKASKGVLTGIECIFKSSLIRSVTRQASTFSPIEDISLASGHHDIELGDGVSVDISDSELLKSSERRCREISYCRSFCFRLSSDRWQVIVTLDLHARLFRRVSILDVDTLSMSRRWIRDDFMLSSISPPIFLSRSHPDAFFMPFTHALSSSIFLVQFHRHVTRISSTMRGKEKDV